MKTKLYWMILLVGLLIGVAACGSAETEPGPLPVTDVAEQVAADALPAARLALADYLGVEADALELEQIEDAEWPNACLGLAEPGEMCAEVLTPGYRILFTYAGETYVVRTNVSGSAARVEAAAEEPTTDELPPAVTAARETLAQQLDVEPIEAEVLSYEQREWSDSCLGLGGPAESCLAAITPGWQVMLGVAGQAYEVRTDETGEQVRVAEDVGSQPAGEAPDPDLEGASLLYQRSGGIAGELVTVRVYDGGTVERIAGRLDPDAPMEMVERDPAAVDALLAELEAIGYFQLERSYLPEDTCCDRFLYLISVLQDEDAHTVEALSGTTETPEALWESVELIETFISESFGQ
ncbi:MAG: hypothetical protein R3300_00830 [Candidatus Promineifilaceae bacterium]|nr:hypothetical protein [Candidatus Promineifilaceae bacterium]